MKKFLVLIVVILVILVGMSLYTIDERELGLKFRLGQLIDVNTKAGLYFKTPFINKVIKFDKRIQTLDSQPENFLTSEKKNLVVDSFVKWRIKNAEIFYITTNGNINRANELLSQIIRTGLKSQFGRRTIAEVVSGERNEIMVNIKEIAKEKVKSLGIDIVDVRITRIDLSKTVSDSVFRRMEAERQRVAKEFRSTGSEQATIIRSEAEKERTIMLAEAVQISNELKGEGEAISSNIYAKAFNENIKFYDFYRSLETYRKSFIKNNIWILDPKSDFFKYLDLGNKTNK